jgi:hypothetical protein
MEPLEEGRYRKSRSSRTFSRDERMMAGLSGPFHYHRLKPDKQSRITDNFRVSLTGEVVGVAG